MWSRILSNRGSVLRGLSYSVLYCEPNTLLSKEIIPLSVAYCLVYALV